MKELDKKLLEEAKRARLFSYSPYSDCKVGAAVRTTDGKIYIGCNVENKFLGNSICAERTAVFRAISEGERQIEALAVVADTKSPIPPCGACRQIIIEFGISTVIMANMKDDVLVMTGEELLPRSFNKEYMGK
jgi:cytidine deaminase